MAVNGNNGDEVLEGAPSGASEQIFGNGGNDDILPGFAVQVTMDGGTGIDWADFRKFTTGVSVSLLTGIGTIPGFSNTYTLFNFENLQGGSGNDFLIGDGNPNVLSGLGGADSMTGGGGNDELQGGPGDDFFFWSGTGSDNLFGQDGIDTVSYVQALSAITADLASGSASGAGFTDFLSSIERVIGSVFDDTLIGSVNNDTLFGVDGNDLFVGSLGSDRLEGGGGVDTVDYSSFQVLASLLSGVVVFTGLAGSDTLVDIENLTAGSGADQLTGNGLDNVLRGGAGVDKLNGGGGNDSLVGGAGNDALDGGDGNDWVHYTLAPSAVQVNLVSGFATGGHGSDSIANVENASGSAFDDTLVGDAAANELQGLDGIDLLFGLGGDDQLSGGGGSDTLEGGDGADTLEGGAGFDTLIGGSGNDQLRGGGDSDLLDGGVGSDALDGGDGIDWADYRAFTADVSASLVTNSATVAGSDDADALVSIENLLGGSGNDTLTGDAADNQLVGEGGNDTLSGGLGDDILLGNDGIDLADYASAQSAVQVNLFSNVANGGDGNDSLGGIENARGSAFDDTLTGGDGANRLSGEGGNDEVSGGLGDDILDGGDGIDWVRYASAQTAVTVSLLGNVASGGGGNDTLSGFENVGGSAFDDTLTGDTGANELQGLAGKDTLNGGAGDDRLFGGLGDDVLDGGDDSDQLFGDDDNDSLSGGSGADVLDGGNGNDTLSGGDGDDQLLGAGGKDNLLGGSGADDLSGGDDADILDGGADDDVLDGGDGDDQVMGGEGADQLVGGRGNDQMNGEGGADRLDGGVGGDLLFGGDGADELFGGDENDELSGGEGDDLLDGGAGNDTAIYAGNRAAYVIVAAASGLTVTHADEGVDTLTAIEFLQFNDQTISVAAVDNTAPTVSAVIPADGATSVAIGSNIVLVFNESVTLGSGNILLKTASGATVETFNAAASSNLSTSGSTLTINPTADLDYGTQYRVELAAGTVKDSSANSYAGSTTGYSFTTQTQSALNLIGTPGDDIRTGGAGDDRFDALGGNDRMTGGAGNDVIDGGPGVDTAVYAGTRADFTVSKQGTTFTVTDTSGTEGADLLKGMERVEFSDKSFDLVNPARVGFPEPRKDLGFLFDPAYYLLSNPELVPTVTRSTALTHYLDVGAAQGKDPNSWFDPTYYENKWADLKVQNWTDDILFKHYNLFGVWEGRAAGPKFDQFDGERYLADWRDVEIMVDSILDYFLGSRTNGAIAHFIIYGNDEQRIAYDLAGQPIDMGFIL